MVGDLEHVRPAAVAGEQQRAGGAAAARRQGPARSASRRSSVGARAIADVHADRLPDPDPLADRERPGVGVGADDRPDEEIAALVLGLVLVDHQAEHQALGREPLLARVEIADRLSQALDRRARGELVDQVAGGRGDRHLRANRGRPLRDAGNQQDAGQRAGDGAGVEHVPVSKQCRGAAGGGAREATEHREPGTALVQITQQGLGTERVRVGEQDQRLAEPLAVGQPAERDAVLGRLGLEMVGDDPGPGSGQGPDDGAGPPSISRPPPTTPPAPHPISDAGASRPCTSERIGLACPMCGAPANTSAKSQLPPRPRAAASAASENAATGSISSETPTAMLTAMAEP